MIDGNSECSRLNYDPNKNYCCKDSNENRNSVICFGDSGGPLMFYDKNGKWYIYGLTSYTVGSCMNKYPTFFTKVPSFLDWIGNAIANL